MARFTSKRSGSCGFTRFCRSSQKSHTRGSRRKPGRERFVRSGRDGEFDRLSGRPTAYCAHTVHTWHPPERAHYAKYVPCMCRAWRPNDDSLSSGDGEDDRLERADVIDAEGVEKHGDEARGMRENAPNEANFDEAVSNVEAQEPIQVTATSGALSGLDNVERTVGDKPNAGSLSLGRITGISTGAALDGRRRPGTGRGRHAGHRGALWV